MNRYPYPNQIVLPKLFIVSALAATSNLKKNESKSILHECSLVTNENRLPHVEYSRNGELKPSSVLCTAIAHYVFYIRIKLHIASRQFALILLGRAIMFQVDENVHYGSAKSNGIVNTIERK